MKTATLAASCLLALIPLSAATAQNAAPGTQPRPLVGGHGGNVEAFIAQHDDNHDGRVPWAEFETFRRQRFDATDENGNGTVSVEEYVQEFNDRYRQALENARGAHLEQTHTRFASLDTDKDGRVTRAEFDASGERIFERYQTLLKDEPVKETDATPRPRRNLLSMPSSHHLAGMLELFDSNGDGTVARAEFDQARSELFARIDQDKDGTLRKEDYLTEFEDRLDRRIATLMDGSDEQTDVRFGALDTDKNGQMTWDEYQVSGKRMFDHTDRNKNGVVDSADATLPAPPRPERPATQDGR